MTNQDFASSYTTMKEEDVKAYVTSQMRYFSEDAELDVKEIGDGNLNYIFRVKDKATDRSVIIKQAGPVARISDEFVVSPDRNRIEYDILKLQGELAPGLVPGVYHYDSMMNCMSMEDLSDHQIMRDALMEKKHLPAFSDHITTFLVKTLLHTSDVVMNHKEKKDEVRSFINPDLCEISEDLVFTEPFYDCPRNDVFEGTKPVVEQEIWADEALKLETAKLKFDFMTHAQALIHGDLHTGSVFVQEGSTKVIDPEFAFYGPAGYDVGNVVANLMFAYVNGSVTMDAGTEKEEYLAFLERTIKEVVDLFISKFQAEWDSVEKDRTATYEGFQAYYLDGILEDASGVAGCELIRRTVGIAHVKDLTAIEDEKARVRAETVCLRTGKRLVMDRAAIKSGAAFFDVLQKQLSDTMKEA
ncbi:S-methyl-5-thioribose kinase [Salisediminibacterium selenitireducens]|uniref:S-methyl-5-thioribose kinase n=1 Tax=Bacillus selenitireducens (strain ATCC 700615 / DSM 15326 / MLS10) TaxID=439292 RepID=D6Y0N5_BACIE|nr:S-methyl-5-thioribose kinase [Salisediminibacterium selenitireducens]ADI00603.1 5-methylthioribose kinase [[Bacillus] selenitireducens MLS10]